jgi:hypothetical protein
VWVAIFCVIIESRPLDDSDLAIAKWPTVAIISPFWRHSDDIFTSMAI